MLIYTTSLSYSCIVGGSCPGMLIIQMLRAYALERFIVHLLRAHALGCFNHPTVEGSCPGMLVIQRA